MVRGSRTISPFGDHSTIGTSPLLRCAATRALTGKSPSPAGAERVMT
jgi:hypothetical protein